MVLTLLGFRKENIVCCCFAFGGHALLCCLLLKPCSPSGLEMPLLFLRGAREALQCVTQCSWAAILRALIWLGVKPHGGLTGDRFRLEAFIFSAGEAEWLPVCD